MSFFSLLHAVRRTSAVACVLFAGFAAALATPVAAAPVSYIYGIDDSNDIWELDPIGQTATKVFTTNLPGTANSNAFAYDNTRENMFFLNGSGTSSTLYVWNKPTNSLSVAATAAQLGITSGSLQPANAAFNPTDGKYYFFEDGTADLYGISFTYSGNIPTFSASSSVTVAGITAGTNLYGDIAIDNGTTPNLLYGSTTDGNFFTVDLTSPATTYNPVGLNGISPTTGLQLSFNVNYTTLYGQAFGTANWYTINLGSGEPDGPSIWTSPVAFRDLGGASLTQAVVPEIDPAAFGGVLALVLGSLGLLERRRMAAAA